ncbi:MAG: hypothetical protein A2015_17015 [Spirochaetes bacterium GWF1_31_7]|nr:MAG: hypothetical protein A2Y30_14380 [Spirochaetes bacterium GWE1_32_154]OHD50143.1 MAG: hypothetical protein A2Y29_12425 [Spirochaetes bacterium GWE2_31_10]OHD52457.1 MAG: hypothetical protein A2015_17015 [Spirochaetes bacterium GWF1_31_7]OHD81951.1 MAG: hypothetical protein A2355_17640 [Spirochaetes bacterium RIFOXYB1_FULL_32_8]HBI38614.1 hypothetical protein [Spirochaetia bacterium]
MNYLLQTQGILFDLDGVIADTRVVLKETWTKWCNRNAIDIEKIREVSHGKRPFDTISIVAPHLNTLEQVKILSEIENSICHRLTRLNGIMELLNSIPDIKWGVCTSSTRECAVSKLQHAIGYKPYCLVCSEDVEHGKPNPEAYIKAAGILKINPANLIVFEDSKAGIESAKTAGCKVIGVSAASNKSLLIDADYVIHDFTDIRVVNITDKKATINLRGNSKTLL